MSPRRNAAITGSFSEAFSWPCSRPTRRPAEHRLAQPLQLGGGRACLHALGTVDQGADHEGAVARGHLGPDPLPHLVVVCVGPRPRSGHRSPSRRELVQDGHVEVPEDDHRRRPRDRGGRHHEHIGVGTRTVAASRPFALSAARCSTPNRCCSSTTTTPSDANRTSSVRRAWVPTTRSTDPSARPRSHPGPSPAPRCGS